MSESNLRQNTNIGARVFINEYSGLNIIDHGGNLGDRYYTVENKIIQGNNVVFILKAAPNEGETEPHDFGNRHATVEPNGRMIVYSIHNGVHYPNDIMIINRDGVNDIPQGGKKKRKTKKLRKGNKTKRSKKSLTKSKKKKGKK